MTLCGSGSRRRIPQKRPGPPAPRTRRTSGLVEARPGRWAIIQPVDAPKAPQPSRSDGPKEHNPPTPRRQVLITAKSTLFWAAIPPRSPPEAPFQPGSDDPREVDPGCSHAPAPPGLQASNPPCFHASESGLDATMPRCHDAKRRKTAPREAGYVNPSEPGCVNHSEPGCVNPVRARTRNPVRRAPPRQPIRHVNRGDTPRLAVHVPQRSAWAADSPIPLSARERG